MKTYLKPCCILFMFIVGCANVNRGDNETTSDQFKDWKVKDSIKTESGALLSKEIKLEIWDQMTVIEDLSTKEGQEKYPLTNKNGVSLNVSSDYVMQEVNFEQERLEIHKRELYHKYNISENTYSSIMTLGFKENWRNVLHKKN